MTDDARFRLRFGPYQTPRFRPGDVVRCALRGEVVLCGLSDSRIPWPTGRRRGRERGRPAIVLYGALAEAVRRESAQAVGHWFGVGPVAVWKWRRALRVGSRISPSP